MIVPKIRSARIHPFVTIALVVVLFATIGGIILIWNNISQRADQAIQVQNVVETNGKTTIYVQNIGEGTVLLESVQIDDEKILIQSKMCNISGDYTNLLPKEKTASIIVEKSIEKVSRIKVYAKGGAFAVWYVTS